MLKTRTWPGTVAVIVALMLAGCGGSDGGGGSDRPGGGEGGVAEEDTSDGVPKLPPLLDTSKYTLEVERCDLTVDGTLTNLTGSEAEFAIVLRYGQDVEVSDDPARWVGPLADTESVDFTVSSETVNVDPDDCEVVGVQVIGYALRDDHDPSNTL